MAIQDTDALVELLKLDLGDVADSLSDDQTARAVNSALAELGWTLPSLDAQDYWLTKRAARHAIYILLIMSAPKFKYNNINLNQRFDHYKLLVELMDTEFGRAMKDNLILFNSVTPGQLFGEVIPAGFVYGDWGRDLTYGADPYFPSVGGN